MDRKAPTIEEILRPISPMASELFNRLSTGMKSIANTEERIAYDNNARVWTTAYYHAGKQIFHVHLSNNACTISMYGGVLRKMMKNNEERKLYPKFTKPVVQLGNIQDVDAFLRLVELRIKPSGGLDHYMAEKS